MIRALSRPFLRVPPFPGANIRSFLGQSYGSRRADNSDASALLAEIRHSRVGGSYWAKQPELPPSPYTLVRTEDRQACRVDGALIWIKHTIDVAGRIVCGDCDPWHLLSGAEQVIVDADDELALIAAIAGVPIKILGEGQFSELFQGGPDVVESVFREYLVNGFDYVDPFTGEQIDAAAAVRHCAFWRKLIDSNRDISAAFGFAFWKRPTVGPLLWNGEGHVPFASEIKGANLNGAVAVWKSRTSDKLLQVLERKAGLIEVEDGFIRSAGLGADCVPPLSIVIDRRGVHFDPARASDLEELLQNGDMSAEDLDRARDLRRLITESGISKYGAESADASGRRSKRRHVLVPGQVEDDRAVLSGGGPVRGNLDLLRRARAQEPDAYILYKPHPDVEAGHRAGAIPDANCLRLADEVVRDQPISALIDLVDGLHVNSSLAGFEALLRSKPVTTHGVPFYAGWGLTCDLGPIPERRTTRRTLDELVAAVLLLYPRYLDPVTGLPCPPEVLVHRLAEGAADHSGGAVVQLRRLQGRLRKRLGGLSPR